MAFFSIVGVGLACVGAFMLVAPRVMRPLLRAVFAVKITAGVYERVAAWGLIALGLAILVVARLVR